MKGYYSYGHMTRKANLFRKNTDLPRLYKEYITAPNKFH